MKNMDGEATPDTQAQYCTCAPDSARRYFLSADADANLILVCPVCGKPLDAKDGEA